MRLRQTCLGLLLGLVLALGIALGAPSMAWAQQFWTTVGSAGTVDESSQVTLTGPNAALAGGTLAVIRYNVVAGDGRVVERRDREVAPLVSSMASKSGWSESRCGGCRPRARRRPSKRGTVYSDDGAR